VAAAALEAPRCPDPARGNPDQWLIIHGLASGKDLASCGLAERRWAAQAQFAPCAVAEERRGAWALRSLVATAARRRGSIAAMLGAVSSARGASDAQAGQECAAAHSAIGRRAVKGPQRAHS
jgi:hypothetical protein